MELLKILLFYRFVKCEKEDSMDWKMRSWLGMGENFVGFSVGVGLVGMDGMVDVSFVEGW